MLAYDPTSDWQHYDGPLLAIYGGQDQNVPAEPNAAALTHASERPGRTNVHVEIVPRANHDGLDPVTQDGDIATFAPGYLDRALQWVVGQTHPSTAHPGLDR